MPPFEDDTVSIFSSCDTIDTFGTEDLASLGEEEIPVQHYGHDTVDGDVDDYSGMAITVDDTTLTNDYDYQDYQEDFNDHEEEEDTVEESAANHHHPTCSTVVSSSSSSHRRRRPSSRTFFREGVNSVTDVSPQRPRRSLSLSRPLLLPPDSVKGCTFAAEEDLVHIYNVPCLVELLTTPEERSMIWYSSDEQQVILTECIVTARALRQTTATLATNRESASETSSSDLHRHHQSHYRDSLDLLQSKLVDEHEELTDRGLEFMSSVGFDISRNSRAAVQAVLQEQDRLRQELLVARNEREPETVSSFVSALSPSDPDRLSHVCRRTSAHRQRIAHLMGIRDARAVQDDDFNLNKSKNSNSSGSISSRLMGSYSMHSSSNSTSSSHASGSQSSSGKHDSHGKTLQREGSLRRINPWSQPPPSTSLSPSQLQRKNHHPPQHRLSHPSMTRSLHDSGGRARARQARREQSFSAARLRQSQDTK
jgi:hypothetical protein